MAPEPLVVRERAVMDVSFVETDAASDACTCNAHSHSRRKCENISPRRGGSVRVSDKAVRPFGRVERVVHRICQLVLRWANPAQFRPEREIERERKREGGRERDGERARASEILLLAKSGSKVSHASASMNRFKMPPPSPVRVYHGSR